MSEDDDLRRRNRLATQAIVSRVFKAPTFTLWKPDWNTWRHIPKLKLWEAVALSCSIDPQCFGTQLEALPLDDPSNVNLPEEFQRRMRIATTNLGESLKPIATAPAETLDQNEAVAIVRLADFQTWAASIGLELPREFPQSQTPTTQEPSDQLSHERPLGTRERATLLTIIAALAEMVNIDLSKPTKAAEIIEDMTARKGARVAARTIEEHLKRIPDALERRSKP